MRAIVISALILLTGCGFAPTDIAIGGAATYALFGDDIEKIDAATLDDPAKVYRDAVPPQAKQGAHRVANNFRDNVRHNSRRMKEWWFYDPQKDTAQNRAIPSSYCYTALQDIVCYRQPMPGWEHRLVGYQGTGAAPPPPAFTKPLPILSRNDSKLPANRLANAEPVFKEIPQDMKQDKKEAEAGEAPQPVNDAAQEILPDPTLAPQL